MNRAGITYTSTDLGVLQPEVWASSWILGKTLIYGPVFWLCLGLSSLMFVMWMTGV